MVLAAKHKAVGGSQSRPTRPPTRNKVSVRLPNEVVLSFGDMGQGTINRLLKATGAIGFLTSENDIVDNIADLPEGGEVTLLMPPFRTPIAQATPTIPRGSDEQQLVACVQTIVVTENPGAAVTLLYKLHFKGKDGQDYLTIDAGWLVGDTLHLAEIEDTLSMKSVGALFLKLVKIREAVEGDKSPALASALAGVQQVKLYLAGHQLAAGLAAEDLRARSAVMGMSVNVVMPSGAAVGAAALAQPLLAQRPA